ncbi:hypothetical protein [Gemmatimonas sp.]|jgi:hypothetical protein|uniref:hypothetical protein n=1 Tax=Gemmatimonas sp. TaxID=1962908 RepID=UPI0037BEC14E
MSQSDQTTGQFANQLRVRPEVLHIAPAGAAATWVVRVQAAEAWDAVRVACAPQNTVQELKRAAMANLLPDIAEIDAYLVKLHGAEVTQESVTLQAAGAQDASTFFLTSRRRRPLK